MNKLDIVFAVLMLVFFFLGFRKGIAASLISLCTLVLSIILIARFGPLVKNGLMQKISLNNTLATIIAYLIIFLTIFILGKIAIIIMNKVIKTIKLSWLNKSLGGLFGIANYLIILMILYCIIQIIPQNESIFSVFEGSKTIQLVKFLTEKFSLIVADKIPQPVLPTI